MFYVLRCNTSVQMKKPKLNFMILFPPCVAGFILALSEKSLACVYPDSVGESRGVKITPQAT